MSRGFALVELLTVLAIAGVLAALAAPDFGRMLRRHQLNATVEDLYSALEQTRAHAIARGSRVILVPSASGQSGWNGGWSVMVDEDGDRHAGKDEELISVHPAVIEGITITSGFSGQSSLYVAYNGAGRSCTDTSSAAARWGSFTVTDGATTRRIRINMLGRVRVCEPARDGAACGADE